MSHTHTLLCISHPSDPSPTTQPPSWIALLEKEVAFEHTIVDLQEKPQIFSDLYSSIHPDPTARAKVFWFVGAHCLRRGSGGSFDSRHVHPRITKVPILEHGEEVKLIESAVCADYIAEAFPGVS